MPCPTSGAGLVVAAVLQRERSDFFPRHFAFLLHSCHSHTRTRWRLAFVFLVKLLTQSLLCSLRMAWRKWRGIKNVKRFISFFPSPNSYSFTRYCRMLSTCRNGRKRICEEAPPSFSIRGHHHHTRAAHFEWRVPALEHRSEQALNATSGTIFVRRNHHLTFYQIVKRNYLLSCPLDAAPKWLTLQHAHAASSSN